jgi:hypothetical protein
MVISSATEAGRAPAAALAKEGCDGSPRLARTRRGAQLSQWWPLASWPRATPSSAVRNGGEEQPGMVRWVQHGEAEVVVCFTWPVTDASVRTAARTRALLALHCGRTS